MPRIKHDTPDNAVELYLNDFYNFKVDNLREWVRQNSYNYSFIKRKAKLNNIKLPIRSSCSLDRTVNWESNKDLIDAHMLGDGCIVNPKKRNTSVIQLCVKNKDYLQWCINNSPFWNDCSIWDASQLDKRTNKIYERYWIKSKSSHYLEKQRSRWYANCKKRLPSDLQITSRGLLRFYMEDGGRCPHGGVIFSVHNFNPDEINLIKSKIDNIVNCECSIWCEYNVPVKLYIPKSHLNNFYNIIGECPVDSLAYKWD